MSSFSDISHMNLADIDKKSPAIEEEEDVIKEADLVEAQEDEADKAALKPAGNVENAISEYPGDEGEGESEMDRALARAMALEDAELAGEDADAEEVIKNSGKMLEPVGEFYRVDAQIEESDLVSFLFGHTYRQPGTLFVSLLCIVYLLYAVIAQKAQTRMMYGVFAVVVMDVIYPITLYLRAKATKKTETYQKTFHYMFDEWGLHLELGSDAVDVEWKRVFKMRFLKSIVLVYTGKANAFVIPYRSMGAQKDEICEFLKDHSRQIVLKK